MFLADGGGGGTSSGQTLGGTRTLRIEWDAIPGALAAFRSARDRVGKKVDELNGLDIQPWAHDPVSGQTANHFTERSTGAGDSAAQCLRQYHEQLTNVVTALEDTQRKYSHMNSDNTARLGG